MLVTCSTEYQGDEALAAAAIEALRDEPVRVIVTLADAHGVGELPQAPNVRIERFVAHGPVLQHAAAVICHSGMGIVQKAIAARVPIVAVPFGRDQPEVGRRIAESGTGVLVKHKDLSAARLKSAVREARGLRLTRELWHSGDTTSLAARRLGVQDMSIGAAASYLARYGTPVDIEDFEGHLGIAYSRAGVVSPWRMRDKDGVERELRIEPRVSLDDVQAIAEAGVAGLGLVQLPCWLLARYVAAGKLVAVKECCGVRPQAIHAVWSKTPYLPSKTRYAIDALVAEVPPINVGPDGGIGTPAVSPSLAV